MKRHLLHTVLFLAGMVMFTSCLKDDPKNNATVYYGYQQIPNINEFMPQRLLEAFGNEYLNYGDEPPKIEGSIQSSSSSYETDGWQMDVRGIKKMGTRSAKWSP